MTGMHHNTQLFIGSDGVLIILAEAGHKTVILLSLPPKKL
jgi:hypothetical protein